VNALVPIRMSGPDKSRKTMLGSSPARRKPDESRNGCQNAAQVSEDSSDGSKDRTDRPGVAIYGLLVANKGVIEGEVHTI